MKALRVTLAVLALSALPFVAVAAQGQSAANKCKNSPQAGKNEPSQRGAAAAAEAQLHKNCGAPVPPPTVPPPAVPPPPSSEPPPTGPHWVDGLVYEDVDGDGTFSMFAGEMGMAGWTVNLSWNGQVIASAVSDANGQFRFGALANATAYNVCVVEQGGYNRTQPVAADACYPFSFSSSIGTLFPASFGMMLPQ